MEEQQTALPGVIIIEPNILSDNRGLFYESYNPNYHRIQGLENPFVQDNVSHSKQNVLRGLHLQHPNGQGKLVSVIRGAVLDIAVDVRLGSPTFGRHVAVELDEFSRRQLWIPRGFAHGFLVLSKNADFLYKCDAPYSRADEISIRWNDPQLGIAWPIPDPTLSAKDAAAPLLAELGDRLPRFA
ncbi:MAG: dTDP-4-dehydrorhamnose 3,5-epimerase [Rhodomicrobium sp.]